MTLAHGGLGIMIIGIIVAVACGKRKHIVALKPGESSDSRGLYRDLSGRTSHLKGPNYDGRPGTFT